MISAKVNVMNRYKHGLTSNHDIELHGIHSIYKFGPGATHLGFAPCSENSNSRLAIAMLQVKLLLRSWVIFLVIQQTEWALRASQSRL